MTLPEWQCNQFFRTSVDDEYLDEKRHIHMRGYIMYLYLYLLIEILCYNIVSAYTIIIGI